MCIKPLFVALTLVEYASKFCDIHWEATLRATEVRHGFIIVE